MNQLTNQLINFFFPPLCVHCQREGLWLCPTAQEKLAAEPMFQEVIALPYIDGVFIRGSYDGQILQQLIHKLKYSYWSAARAILPDVLVPLIPSFKQLPSDTVITPVPLHPRRIRERGFNQALLLAQALHAISGWPIRPLLKRRRYTAPQAQLSEKRRRKNVVDAFVIAKKLREIPSSVVLVDDVLTTGSTLSECAKVLKARGVRHVYACTLAKG